MSMKLVLALLLQDFAPALAQLGSDSIEEREEAAERLLGGGDAAVPALEKAARDADAEVAARAREVLERVSLHRWLVRLLQCDCPFVFEPPEETEDWVCTLTREESPVPWLVTGRSARWRKDMRLRVGVMR